MFLPCGKPQYPEQDQYAPINTHTVGHSPNNNHESNAAPTGSPSSATETVLACVYLSAQLQTLCPQSVQTTASK